MYNITHKLSEGKCMEKKRKKQSEKSYPAALTVSASDACGSSGIQADLRTFNAFGVFGCSVVTAVASPNPRLAGRVDLLPGASVAAQIEAVISGLGAVSVKSGMLGSAENVEALASAVKKYKLSLVCDPAIYSSAGSRWLDDDGVAALKQQLLPLAGWITPGIREAELLLGTEIRSIDDQIRAAAELQKQFGTPVLLKGGDAGNNAAKGKLPRIIDVVCRNGELWKISSLKADVPVSASYGAGCTLSAALAASFALELSWKEAVCESRSFVMGSLIENIRIGNDLYAMYPPGNDYMNSIQLESVNLK